MLIESLRTDSLYLFETKIRVSLLLAFLSMLTAIVLLIINRFRTRNDPQKMLVNASAAIEAPEKTGKEG